MDGGGLAGNAMGAVTTIEEGLMISQDLYEPDDRQAMLARYAELGGGQRQLGDRRPEGWLRRYIRGHASRDLDLIARVTPIDWYVVDHRTLGWGEMRGLESHLQLTRSSWKAWDAVTLEVDEVLACSDSAIAAQVAYRGISAYGGGRSELPLGFVLHATGLELFDPDDSEGMLARYAKLDGRREAVLGDRPPERVWIEYNRRLQTRDVDQMVELYAAAPRSCASGWWQWSRQAG